MTARCTIHYDEGRDWLVLHASPLDTDLIRTVPGWGFDGATGLWTCKAAYSVALATRGVFGEELAVTPQANAWGLRQKRRGEFAELVRSGLWKPPPGPDGYAVPLDPDQLRAVVFKSEMEAVLDASELGAGKTITTIEAVDRLAWLAERGVRANPYPVLVVSTTSMSYTWADEITKWSPQAEVTVLDGGEKHWRKQLADVTPIGVGSVDAEEQWVVVPWQALRKLSRLASYGSVSLSDAEREPGPLNAYGAGTVIADELHRAKEPKAKQTRALWAVGDPAHYRFGLTATPVNENAADVWPLMRFVAPHEYPTKTRWVNRYTINALGRGGGLEVFGFMPSTRAELDQFLMPRFIRFPKPPGAGRFPPQVRWMEMGPKQGKAYRALAKEALLKLEDEILVAPNPLTKMGRLLAVAAATPVLGTKVVKDTDPETGEVTEREVTTITELTLPSVKWDALWALVDPKEGEAPDEQLVVFAQSRLLIELMERELKGKGIEVVSITGEVPAEQRKINVDTFQHHDAQIALCTLGAGSESITLTAASTAMFLQRSFRNVENVQAEGRIDRRGQTRPVGIIDVVTRGTVETHVHETAAQKDEQLQQLVRDPGWWKRVLA